MKILIWIFIMGLSGCQNSGKSSQTQNLISTKWNFVGVHHIENRKVESVPEQLSGMKISFNNIHRFTAASSCNTVYGYYSVTGKNSIKIDSISITKMFCIDSLQTIWEDKYIAGLKGSRSFEIRKDTLSIITGTNNRLIFKSESKNQK